MCLALSALIGQVLLLARLQGITQLGVWAAFALFTAQVLAGVSTFALGATFNYLVSLFHREPVRQGLFGDGPRGHPLFDPPLDRHFGSLGLLAHLGGLLLCAASLGFGLSGWPVSRLWLYLLGSALLILAGLQLIISWIVMRVLEGLNQREMLVSADLSGRPAERSEEGSTAESAKYPFEDKGDATE